MNHRLTASKEQNAKSAGGSARIAVDIGSTVIKVARLDCDGRLLRQDFYDRDAETGISDQVETILGPDALSPPPLFCSSANGGLRVGIVCLTHSFSGATFRNQVLLAGANPVFVQALDEAHDDLSVVDVLLIGGGIDCPDAGPLAARLEEFDAGRYRFGTLMYAGNRHLAAAFRARYPNAEIVENPLADDLRGRKTPVWSALRDAYLNDLVHKECVSGLRQRFPGPIWPTPEVVNYGFRRAVSGQSDIDAGGPCLLLDIGGATTDIHYTVEIVRRSSLDKLPAGSSVARYVFTDLGTRFSRDTALLQLRGHPRAYEFLSRVIDGDVREAYRQLREGEFESSLEVMALTCLFLALDRFMQGQGDGLPAADPEKISQILVSGGGGLSLDETAIDRMLGAFYRQPRMHPAIFIDRDYRLWVDGITVLADGEASPCSPSAADTT